MKSPPKELSKEGTTFIKDLSDVIEQAKLLILSKNDGQILQEFFWAAGHTGLKKPEIQKGEKKETPAESAKPGEKTNEQVLEGVKTLGNLIITNGEFRKLCTSHPPANHPEVFVLTYNCSA